MNLNIKHIATKVVWENFLLRQSPNSLFQSWLWLDVQEKLGQKVWRMGLFDEKKLVGVFGIIKITARRGTFLHVRHGPTFIEQKKEYWNEFISFIKKIAFEEYAWFVRISPLIEDSESNRTTLRKLSFTPSAIHAMDAELSWVLDIDKPRELLLSGMRKTTRYEIRQAEKLGVTVTQSTDPKDFTAFMNLYEQTSERQKFVPHTGIEEEFDVLAKAGKALVFLGLYAGEAIAGAVILFWGKQAFYHHGASKPSRIPASYLVQWKAIEEAQKRGIKVYNFWGIAPENKLNHPWRGLTLFKKGFGGREVRFIHAHDLPISFLYPIPRLVETMRRVLKGY